MVGLSPVSARRAAVFGAGLAAFLLDILVKKDAKRSDVEMSGSSGACF